MRRWRSSLYIPTSTYRDLAQLSGAAGDPGPPDWPACYVCSKEQRTRWAVEQYGLEHAGTDAKGKPYCDFRAYCSHGTQTRHEDVVRIEGMRHGDPEPVTRVALAALDFFHPSDQHVIPLKSYRALANDYLRFAK